MYRRLGSVLRLLACMLCIFLFSAQPAQTSSQVSDAVKQGIVYVVRLVFPYTDNLAQNAQSGHLLTVLIRKSAHFFLYFLLGIAKVRTLYIFEKGKKKWLWTLLFCALYAASDEWHQTFVEGRGGKESDVLLDTCGAAFGIGLYVLRIHFLRKKEKTVDKMKKM